jgi:replicative DNA helicase
MTVVPMPAKIEELGLPTNAYAETTFLAGILARGERIGEFFQALTEWDFSTDQRKATWAAMVAMHQAGLHIDLQSLPAFAHERGILQRIGGLSAICELSGSEILDLDRYVGMIREASTRRRLIFAAQEIMAAAVLPDRSANELLEAAHQKLQAVTDGAGTTDEFLSPMGVIESYGGLSAYVEHSQRCGVPVPFPLLTEFIGGFQSGDLIVLGGDTGQGKTALALNLAVHAAQAGHGVAIFSMEMSKKQILNRILAILGGFSGGIFRHTLSESQCRRVAGAAADAAELPLWIRDNTGASVANIEGSLRRLKARHSVGLVIVDYLGLLSGEGRSRTEQVSSIARGLKNLAMAVDVPLLALAQFSRAHLTLKAKAELHDLKDSAEIEHAANLALFLEDVEQTMPDDPREPIRIDLRIKKQRDGVKGSAVPLWFTRANGTFSQI